MKTIKRILISDNGHKTGEEIYNRLKYGYDTYVLNSIPPEKHIQFKMSKHNKEKLVDYVNKTGGVFFQSEYPLTMFGIPININDGCIDKVYIEHYWPSSEYKKEFDGMIWGF